MNLQELWLQKEEDDEFDGCLVSDTKIVAAVEKVTLEQKVLIDKAS